MKTILDAVGQTLMMFIKMCIEITTLPCEVLNISDYWAIVYTAVIGGTAILIGRKKKD